MSTAGPQRPDRMPEDMPDRMPDRMPEDMSDRMPEDLPITKCINVMVGITRSKVIYWNKFLVQILGKGHFKSGRPCKTSTKQEFCSSSPFVKKFFFFVSSTKLSEVVQGIAFDALAPDCSIQVLPVLFEVLSAVFMCMQLPGTRVF